MLLCVAVLLFLASFHTSRADGCGGVLTSSSGQITSPNYPNNYPPNSKCDYNITTEPDTVVILKFHNFTLELYFNDYLEIGDTRDDIGVSKLWKFCGTSLPPEIRSSRNSLYLRFESDSSNEMNGFNATYSTTYGGGELTSISGQITSPGYPNTYPPNSRCDYTIRTESTPYRGYTVVTLKFHKFTLQSDSRYTDDHLEIYDGDNSGARELGMFRGTSLPPEIRSSQNSLFLRFHSRNWLMPNHRVDYSGFNATYSTTWLMTNVSVTPMTSSSVRVHWESLYPSVNNYTVTVKPLARRNSTPPGCPAITSAFSVTVNGSTTETVINLPPDLKFRVTVSAESLDVPILPSDVVTGYTLPAASEPVRDLNADLRVKADSVTLTWKAPCDTGGVLNHFMVILEPDRKHQNAQMYILNQTVTQPLQDSYSITIIILSNLTAECQYNVTVIPVGLSGLYGANRTTSFQVPAREPTTTTGNELGTRHFDMATIAILVCVSFVLVALAAICLLMRYRGVTIGRHRFDLSDPCCFSENGSEEPPIELT